MNEPLSQRIARRLPPGVTHRLMPLRWLAARLVRGSFARLGYNVVRLDDYYSPLPNLEELHKTITRWNRPSSLYGVPFDLPAIKTMLSELLSRYYYEEFTSLPSYAEIQQKGFGPGYTAIDGLVLYMMVRHFKPRRYLEVGSGVSTYYCHLAAARNQTEGSATHIECIEPNPYPALQSLTGIRLHREMVQEAGVELFTSLGENDILFIDSSHVLKIDGDLAFIYLEVLPRLAPGAIVHIHDIHFPYNIPYPPEHWIFASPWPKYWNEAMLLQAFLCGNPCYRILLSAPLIEYHNPEFLRTSIPIYQPVDQEPNTFSSIWLQRTPQAWPSPN